MTTEPYRDPERTTDERVEDLLGRMTLEEKVAQLGCVWITSLMDADGFSLPSARQRAPHGIGEVTRISGATALRPAESARVLNEVQRYMVEGTRLGIPVLVHEEGLGGFLARDATVLPQALGLASSFDPDLVESVAGVVRDQMRAVGARHCLAPVLDVARDPRWGRVEETFGEDPYLAGVLGAAYVRGLQTGDLARGVLATGKHFLGHGIPEGGRNHAPVQLGPRELRDVYAEPFAMAIAQAGLGSVMNSYSSVDGLAPAGSRMLLEELLRGELGFEGMVVADYFSLSLLITHHRVAADQEEAAARAINAGMDLELPETACFGEPLLATIASGAVAPATVDRAVRRVLAAKVALGLFEAPYAAAAGAELHFETADQRALARRAAASSLVLLTNDGTLPLPPGIGRVAVLGPGADDPRLLQGDYHYPAHQQIAFDEGPDDAPAGEVPSAGASAGGPDAGGPDAGGTSAGGTSAGGTGADVAPGAADLTLLPRALGEWQPGPYFTDHVTPLAGLRAAVGPATEVVHEKGCEVTGSDGSRIGAAAALAASADAAIVVVAGRSGLARSSTVGEARDATRLELTGPQEALVAAVAATGVPTVVVVLSGRVHALAGVVGAANAVVQAWPLGEEGGNALADVLLGEVNPAGRLPVSLPRSVGQVPRYLGHRAGGATAMFYGAYTDSPTSPLFAFGHGLSYTRFAYGGLVVEGTDTASPVRVAVDVTNVGDRDGDEVVQCYASDLVASVARPDRQLVGFVRVHLRAGETRRVRFEVPPARLAFTDEQLRFVTEPGELRIAVGGSSAEPAAQASVWLGGPVTEHRRAAAEATAVSVGAPGGDRPAAGG